MNPDGAVALVAGGASGLGRATVEALAARGCRVVVLDLQAALERAGAIGHERVPGDVRDVDAVDRAVGRARRAGGLRICVNCAGIGHLAPIARGGEPYDLETCRRVVGVNLIGTFNVARLAAAAMQRGECVDGERGVIVNTTSAAAFDGQRGQTAYAASKGGVAALTLPLARDLARDGIRCVAIAPGVFETPLIATLGAAHRAELARETPHPPRLGRPEEFAALVLAIVESPMLNGETVRLDGALRMRHR